MALPRKSRFLTVEAVRNDKGFFTTGALRTQSYLCDPDNRAAEGTRPYASGGYAGC
jgi:hypothetical protein